MGSKGIERGKTATLVNNSILLSINSNSEIPILPRMPLVLVHRAYRRIDLLHKLCLWVFISFVKNKIGGLP